MREELMKKAGIPSMSRGGDKGSQRKGAARVSAANRRRPRVDGLRLALLHRAGGRHWEGLCRAAGGLAAASERLRPRAEISKASKPKARCASERECACVVCVCVCACVYVRVVTA